MSGAAGPRRILFVSYTAEWTGPTNSLLLLLRPLQKRYHVSVLMAGRGRLEEELTAEGIDHSSMKALDKWSIPAIAGLIKEQKIDLVYGNNTHGSSRNAFLAAMVTKRPFVCHVRGMLGDSGWLRHGYLHWARAVIAVSTACAEAVRRFVGDGRLHVVHNGVPDEWVRSGGADEGTDSRVRIRRELGVPGDACLALSVAHVMPRKGQLHAVEALARGVGSDPEVHLCLAGRLERDPEYVRRVRGLVEDEGLDGRVHILGFREDVRQLLPAADLFLHTAVEDPHPRAVLEAMAAGLPVVAFAVDGVAETVVDGETGLLVDTGDDGELAAVMRRLAASPELRCRMGRAGRARIVSEFTAEATADRIDRILQSVLEGKQERLP